MNIKVSRAARTGRQHFNDLLGVKAFEHGEAILHNRPVEVYLQVASACNLDCYMCYEHLRPPEVRHGRGLKFLEPALFEKIEREIFPYSSRVTFGVGGEPMLCPYLLDYIRRAHAHSQHVHMMTNGTLITSEERAEVMARCLSSLEISVDGATKETYERIRVGAKFESLLRNIELLNEHRLRYPKGDRVHVTLCMVMMQSNIHELPLYVELCRKLHVDRVAAWHVIPVTDEGREDSLYHRPELADRYLHEARALALSYGIEVDFAGSFGGDELELRTVSSASRAEQTRTTAALDAEALLEDEEAWARPLTGKEARAHAAGAPAPARAAGSAPGSEGRLGPRLHCHMPNLTAFVFYDGRVFPCCHPHAHTKMHMGDLNAESFAEIWNNRRYRNLRAGLAGGDPPPLCQRCSIMHSPPPVFENEDELEGEGADLASYYGARDLAPMAEPPPRNLVDFAAESGMADHIAWLEDDNRQKAGHIATIEGERREMRGHIENLEGERPHLVGHIGNLERHLNKIQRNPLYRAGAALRDLLGRPKETS